MNYRWFIYTNVINLCFYLNKCLSLYLNGGIALPGLLNECSVMSKRSVLQLGIDDDDDDAA